MTGVARRIFSNKILKKKNLIFEKKFTCVKLAYMLPPGVLKSSNKKNVSQLGPAVWPAIANIYTNKYIRAKSFII